MREIPLKEMNDAVIRIWDEKIRKYLLQGYITMEMDIQALFRYELETQFNLSNSNTGYMAWRCYHDTKLLRPGKKNSTHGNDCRYDLVLIKYESKDNPKKHYPAVVIEFKIWNKNLTYYKADWDKLCRLESDDYPLDEQGGCCGFIKRPYAYHLMGVLQRNIDKHDNIKGLKKEQQKIWEEIKKSAVLFTPEETIYTLNGMTDYSQCCRYEGKEEKMDWYINAKRIAEGVADKNRVIYVRCSKIL